MAPRKFYFSEINTTSAVTALANSVMSPSESNTAVYKEYTYGLSNTLGWLANMGCSIIGEWGDVSSALNAVTCIFAERVGRYYQEIKQIYNDMTRLSMTPNHDTMTTETERDGMDGAMSENSPVDNTFDVMTPFVKSKGINESHERETVTNDTVDEAVERVRVLNEYKVRLHDIVKEGLYACCDQMISSW